MISREEVLTLAALARLKVTDAEVETLRKDISSILEYVGQVSATPGAQADKTPPLRNVMRNDVEYQDTLVSGKREALVAAFPKQENGYNVVRKIIQKDE